MTGAQKEDGRGGRGTQGQRGNDLRQEEVMSVGTQCTPQGAGGYRRLALRACGGGYM